MEQVSSKMLQASLEAYKQENTDLQETITKLQAELAVLREKVYGGKDCQTYKEWRLDRVKALQYYLEAMMAAYCMETDIPPSKVVLHTAIKNDGAAHVYYWLEHKDDNKDLETAQTFKLFEG